MSSSLRDLDAAQTPRFVQPGSFMRAPFAAAANGVDIAMIGVPYDLGSSNRAGPRHGPAQVREMSRLIRAVNGSTGVSPFQLCKVADLGDAPVNPLDQEQSLKDIEAFFRSICATGAAPLSIGGDHTIPLPVIRALASKRQPLGVVHFDSHPDTSDASYGNRFMNGTPFRRLIEEGLIDPKRYVQVGIRGTRWSDDAINWALAQGVRIINIDEYESLGRAGVIEEIHRVVGKGPVYVTFDVDGLDPVHCPGTGAPEPGGLSMRDSLVMLRSFDDLDVVGGDVCEVSPPLDPSGHTAVNAANLVFEILCVMALARNRRS